MDAQNAAGSGSDKTKPATGSPRRSGGAESTDSKSKSTVGAARATSPLKESKEPKDVKAAADARAAKDGNDGDDDDAAAADANSDADTIVLPGKDGHSPSKARKMKHEDKSDGESLPSRKSRDAGPAKDGGKGSADGSTATLKKRRLHDKQDKQQQQEKQQQQRIKDGSSGLSSAPTSPPPTHRRRSGAHSDSESDTRKRSPRATKDRPKVSDKSNLLPHKRKAPRADSDDEGESRKARRPRTSGATGEAAPPSTRLSKDHRASTSSRTHNEAPATASSGGRLRSVSPPPRAHRRSVSTQLPTQSSNGLSHKKKRVPAPLQSTDYHSDDSSASGSPHPRSSKLRDLKTPHTAESTISPAKMAPHKKHLDAHGQTFLARAVARGDHDTAKVRLAERPEDLNVADYAGNTPLQIAAINGQENIVKLLIDAGCNLDCVNYDKDTPLLDAVDNGHLGVIKLLLDAGVNPRKANVNGEEPIDRVNDELDNAAEIRSALMDARKKMGERRQTSEDHHQDHQDTRSSHGPDSPRRSPAASTHPERAGRRAGTVRATKTSNHLLYMPMDDKQLRHAAGRGDEETVTRILQVRSGCDDPEAMVAAARGGHDVIINLLLALGPANPDPEPITSVPADFSTPMLAAIGQENIKIIDLLLSAGIDPTRRFNKETYYEIAKRRQGPNWKEEEQKLKDAYDRYRKAHKGELTKKSPNRRERVERVERTERSERGDREQERESKRTSRTDSKEEPARSHRRNLSSPSRDAEPRKKVSKEKSTTSPGINRRSNSSNTAHDEQASPKRERAGPVRSRKEERVPTINISDREASPAPSQKLLKTKRSEMADNAGVSSEGEAVKPRRKLVSKGELRGEREKQRRASLVSSASSMKEPSSPQDSRHDDRVEKSKGEPLSEKYRDRTKALKRDESKDRLSVSGEPGSKRHRSSATPPHAGGTDKDDSEVPSKRRRLEGEGKEKRSKLTSSPERHKGPREASAKVKGRDRDRAKDKDKDKDQDDELRKEPKSKADPETRRRESGRSSTSDKSSILVKSEEIDTEMPDAPNTKAADEAEARAKKEREEEEKRQAELAEARKLEEEHKRREAEEKKRQEAEEKKRQEAEEKKRREVEEAKKRREEEEAKRLEEEKKQKEEEERKRKEEEEKEKKRKEEEERKRREEEERKAREEAERRQREEEERKLREEEERLRKEQLEREAAEEERRRREEEERKERERKERERLIREEQERKRAAREAEQRRIFEEQERARLAKLPPLLRWLDQSPNPKILEVADKFKLLQGVRYDTIEPSAIGKPEGREQWVLNTQVALLLGETDLNLSRYTGWERVPVSLIAKKTIWKLERDRYALTSETMFPLGVQVPGLYGDEKDPYNLKFSFLERLRMEAWEKLAAMDLFFVKLSDLLYIVPNIPHLRNIRLSVEYREIFEDEDKLVKFILPNRWMSDPGMEQYYGLAPRNKYYVNGGLVKEKMPGLTQTNDPDYIRICREQGLEHLVNGSQSPTLPNGVHPSPTQSNGPAVLTPQSMGAGVGVETLQPIAADGTQTIATPAAASDTTAAPAAALPNGINGTSGTTS